VNPHYSPHRQSKDPNELTASINMCFENKVLFSAKKTKQYIQNPLPNIEFYTFSPSILCERSAHSQYSFGFVIVHIEVENAGYQGTFVQALHSDRAKFVAKDAVRDHHHADHGPGYPSQSHCPFQKTSLHEPRARK